MLWRNVVATHQQKQQYERKCPVKKGNVQLASEEQFDELRICVAKGFNKLRGRLDQNVAQGWIGNQPSIDKLLEGLVPPDEIIEQQQAILTNRLKKLDLGNVSIVAMPRMKTKDCLKKGITYRDGDLDNWLSDYIPAIGGGSLGGFELTDKNGTTYRQMAESLLETTGSDESLKKLLKERGYTFHPEQLADLLRRTKAGEKTGLLDNGCANLLFIEDENGEVFGCDAYWDDARWNGRGWYVMSTALTTTAGGLLATVSSPATRFELLDPWKLGSARGCSQEQPLLIL
jgi:hypothetical protein